MKMFVGRIYCKTNHYIMIMFLFFCSFLLISAFFVKKVVYFYSFPTTKHSANALLQYFPFIMYFIVFNCVLKARFVTKWATAADVGAIDCMDGWLLPSCTDCK